MNFRTSQNISLIKNAALFANLKDEELSEILENSQIINRKKGEMIFFGEEKIINFYVILAGTVKVFATNEDGAHTILQMIGAKKFINDIFLQTLQVNAQAVSDCIILSIKIAEMQKFTKNNLNLTRNLLCETAEKNADLSDQITRLKLTNSKQKVGQFLLKMAFQNSSKKAELVELEYDKTDLASYLGINPETLSRSLKKLKNDGEIEVKKNKIILKERSLCGYCDSKISAKCSRHKSDFCKQD